eukprot:6313774-Prymnesium_polylepis.1
MSFALARHAQPTLSCTTVSAQCLGEGDAGSSVGPARRAYGEGAANLTRSHASGKVPPGTRELTRDG